MITKKENSYPVGVYLICRARIKGTEIHRGRGDRNGLVPLHLLIPMLWRGLELWSGLMSWWKFVLVFLQSLCITFSCCIFEVRDSYGNVMVIVLMKKCLKMQTETAIKVMIWDYYINLL